jgi:hypothetical protein
MVATTVEGCARGLADDEIRRLLEAEPAGRAAFPARQAIVADAYVIETEETDRAERRHCSVAVHRSWTRVDRLRRHLASTCAK